MKKSFTFIVGIFFLLAIGFVACEKSQDMEAKETVNTYRTKVPKFPFSQKPLPLSINPK